MIAITFVTSLAYKQVASTQPKAVTSIWVRIAFDGSHASAKWAIHQPQYGPWIQLTQNRLIKLHTWLLNNCFLTLGDRVWK